MNTRLLAAAAALLGSAGLGAGVVLLAWAPGAAPPAENRIDSVRGVDSGAGGPPKGQPDPKGVAPIQAENDDAGAQEAPPARSPTEAAPADSQAVELRGVRGTDGSAVQEENTMESVSSEHGSVQSIRGIEGIDSVPLQNLETVLRMQQRPQAEPSGGGARTSARLLTMESDEPAETEEVEDGREELLDFELEGS